MRKQLLIIYLFCLTPSIINTDLSSKKDLLEQTFNQQDTSLIDDSFDNWEDENDKLSIFEKCQNNPYIVVSTVVTIITLTIYILTSIKIKKYKQKKLNHVDSQLQQFKNSWRRGLRI